MADEKSEEKKIIVDEDWKEQSKKEKEELAAKDDVEKKEAAQQQAQRGPLPKGDLAALISMLVTQSMFALGLINMEGQEPRKPDLELAKYNIDMLETLQEKTKGNLTEDEEKVLESTLSQIRMGYVQVAG
jgi:hypothetical protein